MARCRKVLEDARGSLAVRSAGNSRIEDGTRAAVSTADFSTARVEVLAEVASTAGTLAAAADCATLVEDAVRAKTCSSRGKQSLAGWVIQEMRLWHSESVHEASLLRWPGETYWWCVSSRYV